MSKQNVNRESLANRHALRVSVRFHESVVEDRVLPQGREQFTLEEQGIGLPPPDGAESFARFKWLHARRVELTDSRGNVSLIEPSRPVQLVEGDIRVDIALVPTFRVAPSGLSGDVFLLASMLAMIGVSAIMHMLLSLFAGPQGAVGVEPQPELIARLLDKDFEGAEEGFLFEEQERREFTVSSRDFYLPSGDQGPRDALGGSANPTDRAEDGERSDEPQVAKHQPLKPEPTADLDGAPSEVPLIDGVQEPQRFAKRPTGQQDDQSAPKKSAEDTEGWGYRDWYDVEDQRREEIEVQVQLEIAREQVRIDPDAAWALQQLAYYQYLAEDYQDCKKTYDRYIELFPDRPDGYNNLALVYKRTGEYSKEEGYYRLALALEPDDPHALNNLAVNLGHQERYDEALEIMDELHELQPDDPYTDLHRSKIFAAKGDEDSALSFLERALKGMERLDTLHHIEFRQDIRLDPAFIELRKKPVFNEILVRYYGADAAPVHLDGVGGRSG